MSLEEQVVAGLKEKAYSITTAESCTAGMIASHLVNVPGISEFYRQGYITYSNDSKIKLLEVDAEVLAKYGAVSSQVAEQMARGAARQAEADVAIACTGIAGPDGGSAEKPVGLVYIGCYVKGKIEVRKNIFKGDRQEVRKQSAQRALELILECLKQVR